MAESEERIAFKTQANEVQKLVEKFGKLCQITTNLGEFTHVVDVKLDDDEHSDFSIRFQMEGRPGGGTPIRWDTPTLGRQGYGFYQFLY